MDYDFRVTYPKCDKDFVILWVMDKIRVGPESVAKIADPTCEERFSEKVCDLIPFKAQRLDLPTGRPVRTVELVYDCPTCGMRALEFWRNASLDQKQRLHQVLFAKGGECSSGNFGTSTTCLLFSGIELKSAEE